MIWTFFSLRHHPHPPEDGWGWWRKDGGYFRNEFFFFQLFVCFLSGKFWDSIFFEFGIRLPFFLETVIKRIFLWWLVTIGATKRNTTLSSWTFRFPRKKNYKCNWVLMPHTIAEKIRLNKLNSRLWVEIVSTQV